MLFSKTTLNLSTLGLCRWNREFQLTWCCLIRLSKSEELSVSWREVNRQYFWMRVPTDRSSVPPTLNVSEMFHCNIIVCQWNVCNIILYLIVLWVKNQRTASLSRREKTAAARQTDTILPFDVFGVKISINGGGAEGGGRIPRVFCALHRVSYFSHNDLDLWIRGRWKYPYAQNWYEENAEKLSWNAWHWQRRRWTTWYSFTFGLETYKFVDDEAT